MVKRKHLFWSLIGVFAVEVAMLTVVSSGKEYGIWLRLVLGCAVFCVVWLYLLDEILRWLDLLKKMPRNPST